VATRPIDVQRQPGSQACALGRRREVVEGDRLFEELGGLELVGAGLRVCEISAVGKNGFDEMRIVPDSARRLGSFAERGTRNAARDSR
jgi:hypothetical protein